MEPRSATVCRLALPHCLVHPVSCHRFSRRRPEPARTIRARVSTRANSTVLTRRPSGSSAVAAKMRSMAPEEHQQRAAGPPEELGATAAGPRQRQGRHRPRRPRAAPGRRRPRPGRPSPVAAPPPRCRRSSPPPPPAAGPPRRADRAPRASTSAPSKSVQPPRSERSRGRSPSRVSVASAVSTSGVIQSRSTETSSPGRCRPASGQGWLRCHVVPSASLSTGGTPSPRTPVSTRLARPTSSTRSSRSSTRCTSAESVLAMELFAQAPRREVVCAIHRRGMDV